MNDKDMMHGRDWDGIDPTGWLWCEKFHGCRVEWDGSVMWTRDGNIVAAPAWFTQGLPRHQHLSMEIWGGYGRWAAALNAVQHGRFDETITALIFDHPTGTGGKLERLAQVQHRCPHAEIVEHQVCTGTAQLLATMHAVQARGGEGLMICQPSAPHLIGRTRSLLKVKTVPTVLAMNAFIGRRDRYFAAA
jgi:DNA ligase-1